MKKKIAFGIMGEGRGHVTRSLALINELKKDGHEIRVYTSADSSDFLKKYPDIETREVPFSGLIYSKYSINRSLSALRALQQLLGILLKNKSYKEIESDILNFNPDLIITDLEPYTSMVSQRHNIHLISFDHQHILKEKLPFKILFFNPQIHLIRIFMNILFKPNFMIINSFYRPDNSSSPNKLFINNLLRDKITNGDKKVEKGLITIYLKRDIYLKKIMEVITELNGYHFEIFSDFKKENLNTTNASNVKLFKIDENRFIDSLLRSEAVICNAGSQILSELIYLKKPAFVIPEPKTSEQYLNAFYFKKGGFGETSSLRNFDSTKLKYFISNLNNYNSSRATNTDDKDTLGEIKDYISKI